MNINHTFQLKKVRKMQNLGNVYIWGSPFVMSRTDAQNGVDIIFKQQFITAIYPVMRKLFILNEFMTWCTFLDDLVCRFFYVDPSFITDTRLKITNFPLI